MWRLIGTFIIDANKKKALSVRRAVACAER
jgi:hypothetical protein